MHLTLRARAGLPSLRFQRTFAAVQGAIALSSTTRFRILHFSVQSDHVHLIVEADEPRALRVGVGALKIRIARALNRALARRGAVWADRYHARALRTPREVRAALVYVLQNWRKHLRDVRGLDGRSSAAWFDGWAAMPTRPSGPPPVAPARTWLASIGWRRRGVGLLRKDEAPGPKAGAF